MAEAELVVRRDRDALAATVAERLAGAVEAAIGRRGVAHVVLTGGSMGSAVVAATVAAAVQRPLPATGLHLWWGDERFLPVGDPHRNDRQNDEAGLLLLGTLKIPFGINAVVGPRVFPMIVSVGTLALGALLTVNALRGDRAETQAIAEVVRRRPEPQTDSERTRHVATSARPEPTSVTETGRRGHLRVLRDPFSAKPHVLFYATKRVGGGVVDPRAIKMLNFAV